MARGPVGLAGLVLRGGGRVPAGTASILDGAVVEAAAPARRTRRLPDGWIVAPGFVDLQVNGYAGVEVDDPDGGLAAVASALPADGVTAFCPTVVTRSDAGYRRSARALRDGGPAPAWAARPLGAHLEGPFLAPTRPGAHPSGRLRDPDPALMDRLLADFTPRVVTLAPELPGALDLVRRLARRRVVVACGHTEADAATGRAALDAGARLATHAFNAMRGVAHRDPSLLVAFLADPRARVSLIGDGVHVAPEVAALASRLAGPRLVLVSDASAPAGAPAGAYRLGERAIHSDGARAVTADGRLAGAVAPLWRGPVTLAGAGVPVGRALAAACEAPRRLLALPPNLAPGAPADLVVLDPDLVPRLTLVAGLVAHADPGLPFDVPEAGVPFG